MPDVIHLATGFLVGYPRPLSTHQYISAGSSLRSTGIPVVIGTHPIPQKSFGHARLPAERRERRGMGAAPLAPTLTDEADAESVRLTRCGSSGRTRRNCAPTRRHLTLRRQPGSRRSTGVDRAPGWSPCERPHLKPKTSPRPRSLERDAPGYRLRVGSRHARGAPREPRDRAHARRGGRPPQGHHRASWNAPSV